VSGARHPWRAAPLALALAAAPACSDPVTVLAPVVDLPPAGSDADPFVDLDQIVLSLALSGDPDALVSAAFARGQEVVLPDVPFDEDLVVHLTGRIGATEVAYGRTCVFEVAAGREPPAPHLYFARTVKWGDSLAPPTATRTGGTALAAADGSALYLGGTDPADDSLVDMVDRFDPATGAFAAIAPLAPRRAGTFASLGDGRVLAIGGIDDTTSEPAAAYEIIDPFASGQRVDLIEEPRLRRVDHAATTLSGGGVVVIGGRAPDPMAGDALAVTGAVTEVRLTEGGVTEIREIRASLAIPRTGPTLTRVSNELGAPVLVVGGLDASGAPVGLAELYKPLGEVFADPDRFQPMLAAPRHRHAAVRMPDGSVLVVGGLDGAGQPVRSMELFSLDGGFDPAGDLPAGAGIVDASLTPLPDGRVLIAGGRADATPGAPALDTAYIARLDPLDGSVDVVATDRLIRPRAGHQAVLLCDGTVLLVGGTPTPAPAERYNPPEFSRR
jgi:hypothetical protein